MIDCHLSAIEAKFAKILWEHVPLSTRALVALGEKEFGWKRTTTYTVLKNLCQKGLFQLEDREVTALVSKQQFKSLKSHKFIEDNFAGSLPAMVVAFGESKKLSQGEIDELQEIIDRMRGD